MRRKKTRRVARLAQIPRRAKNACSDNKTEPVSEKHPDWQRLPRVWYSYFRYKREETGVQQVSASQTAKAIRR